MAEKLLVWALSKFFSICIYNPKKLDNYRNKRQKGIQFSQEWKIISSWTRNDCALGVFYVVYILIGLFILALHSQCAPCPLSHLFATHFARGVPAGYPILAAIQCGCAPPPPSALLLSLFICHLTAMRQFVVAARRRHTTPYNTIRYDTTLSLST